jgi:hypothetical protein
LVRAGYEGVLTGGEVGRASSNVERHRSSARDVDPDDDSRLGPLTGDRIDVDRGAVLTGVSLAGVRVVVDPGDDYLIALAAAQNAPLVSGDDHLLSPSGELPIYGPRDFLILLEQASD